MPSEIDETYRLSSDTSKKKKADTKVLTTEKTFKDEEIVKMIVDKLNKKEPIVKIRQDLREKNINSTKIDSLFIEAVKV
jgi:hypothetical protein